MPLMARKMYGRECLIERKFSTCTACCTSSSTSTKILQYHFQSLLCAGGIKNYATSFSDDD